MSETTPRMLSIRETAALGPLSEYALRLLLRQDRLPGLYVGKKFLVSYDRLLSLLADGGGSLG